MMDYMPPFFWFAPEKRTRFAYCHAGIRFFACDAHGAGYWIFRFAFAGEESHAGASVFEGGVGWFNAD